MLNAKRLVAPAQRLMLLRGARAASTVGGALEEAAARLPHKEAFRSIKQDLRWSFQELHRFVNELANGFQSLHFEPGDVLAVWLPNSAENYVTQLAAATAGLTLAVIDPAIDSAEDISYVLQDSQANGFLYEPKMAGRNQSELVQCLFPELAGYRDSQVIFRPNKFRCLHTVISTGFDYEEGVIPFSQIFVNSPEPHLAEAVKKALNENTPLAFSYSKEEGMPPKRSSTLTHGDMLQRAADLAHTLALSNTDKICLTGEQGGLSYAPLAALHTSAMLIIPSIEFDRDAVQYAIQLETPSIVGSGATNFERISAVP